MSNVNVLAAAEYVVANRISARTQKPILYTILYYTQKECWAQYGEKAFEATFYKPQMGSFPVCEEVDEKFKKQPTISKDEIKRYHEDIDSRVLAILDEISNAFIKATSFDMVEIIHDDPSWKACGNGKTISPKLMKLQYDLKGSDAYRRVRGKNNNITATV